LSLHVFKSSRIDKSGDRRSPSGFLKLRELWGNGKWLSPPLGGNPQLMVANLPISGTIQKIIELYSLNG
jgi:hypothetical protein